MIINFPDNEAKALDLRVGGRISKRKRSDAPSIAYGSKQPNSDFK